MQSRFGSIITFLAAILIVLASACTPFQNGSGPVSPPSPPDDSEPPVSTTAPNGSEPGTDNGSTVRGTATITDIQVAVLESFPVQVNVIINGTLRDGCTQIDEITQSRRNSTFYIEVNTERPTDAICTQALVPFTETVSLNLSGAAEGEYTVNVNGVTEEFML